MKLDPFSESVREVKIKIEDGFIRLRDVDNLVLNMMSGLLPEHLSKEDVGLLIEEFGDNWFEELGYTESDYKKPTF